MGLWMGMDGCIEIEVVNVWNAHAHCTFQTHQHKQLLRQAIRLHLHSDRPNPTSSSPARRRASLPSTTNSSSTKSSSIITREQHRRQSLPPSSAEEDNDAGVVVSGHVQTTPVERVLQRSEAVSRFLGGVMEGWLPCFAPYHRELNLSGGFVCVWCGGYGRLHARHITHHASTYGPPSLTQYSQSPQKTQTQTTNDHRTAPHRAGGRDPARRRRRVPHPQGCVHGPGRFAARGVVGGVAGAGGVQGGLVGLGD